MKLKKGKVYKIEYNYAGNSNKNLVLIVQVICDTEKVLNHYVDDGIVSRYYVNIILDTDEDEAWEGDRFISDAFLKRADSIKEISKAEIVLEML